MLLARSPDSPQGRGFLVRGELQAARGSALLDSPSPAHSLIRLWGQPRLVWPVGHSPLKRAKDLQLAAAAAFGCDVPSGKNLHLCSLSQRLSSFSSTLVKPSARPSLLAQLHHWPCCASRAKKKRGACTSVQLSLCSRCLRRRGFFMVCAFCASRFTHVVGSRPLGSGGVCSFCGRRVLGARLVSAGVRTLGGRLVPSWSAQFAFAVGSVRLWGWCIVRRRAFWAPLAGLASSGLRCAAAWLVRAVGRGGVQHQLVLGVSALLVGLVLVALGF